MLKANITPFDQSNIAGLGSAADHEQRIKAAKTENEWKGAGSHVGIEKWHVHDFGVHRVNEQKSFNTFFDGDSYIILHTYKKDDKSNAFKYDLYFWLGAHTSQDEAGTAAYKTVELDDLLGEIPVQHREVCGHESPEFLALFGGRIKVLQGGVASAFNHVKPEEYKPRLLHLKGKKHVRATQVPLETKSLNQGDVFLLDAGLTVWIWKGTNAGVFEKREADILAEQIQEERMGKPKVIHLDHNDDDAGFWGLLAGGHNASLIQPAGPADEDEKVSQAEATRNTKSLLVLTDESGQLSVKEVATGKGNIKRSLLKSEDVYILELGALGVYVWVGKNASKNEQKNAISYAVVSLKQRGKDTNIPIRRVIEGGESEQFINAFDA